MKGYVPVTKESLSIMIGFCLEIVEEQYKTKRIKQVKRLIERETSRSTTRRWYRLFTSPKPRFAYFEADVIKWANEADYPMFDCSPFLSLDKDKENSIRWLNSLARVAFSIHAGEPIQLEMDVFKRISNPEIYLWVSASNFCYSVRD